MMVRRQRQGPPKWEWEASKRNYNFIQDIDGIVINTTARLLAVARTAISGVVEDMQKPVAKGGRMRVKTGFLRSSGTASLEGPPRGPTKGDPQKDYRWDGDFLNVVLAKMKIGDTFHWGWTAYYAKYREAYDGFLEAALQNWQQHVDRAVRYFRNKDMKK